jgi:tetratricopeptide (TPR) repeat protein
VACVNAEKSDVESHRDVLLEALDARNRTALLQLIDDDRFLRWLDATGDGELLESLAAILFELESPVDQERHMRATLALADAYWLCGKWPSARSLYGEVLGNTSAVGAIRLRAAVGMARLHRTTGEIQPGLDLLNRELSALESNVDLGLISHAYGMRATCHLVLGSYEDGQKDLLTAVDAAIESEDSALELRWRMYQANGLRDAGSLEEALDRYQRCLQIDVATYGSRDRMNLLGNYARLLDLLDRYGEALSILEQCLQMSRNMKLPRSEANWLGAIGAIHRRMEKIDDSVDYLVRSIEIATRLHDTVCAGRYGVELSKALEQCGRVDESREMAELALACQRSYGDPETRLVEAACPSAPSRALERDPVLLLRDEIERYACKLSKSC